MHAGLLTATLVALMSGPLLYALARRQPPLLGFLDGFVLVSITGLVLLEVVPDALGAGGYWSLLFVALGLLGPTALEHGLTRARREAHMLALALAIGGLALHSIGDGAALAGESHDPHHAALGEEALGLAIAIHSVPVGLVIWWLLYPVFGALLPAFALLAMCAGTLTGYLYAPELSALLGATAWAWFQALIAGSILHVIFGRPHLHETSEHRRTPPIYEGLGNLSALAALAALSVFHSAEPHQLPDFLQRLLGLGLESAPALLLAYLVGGFVSGDLPQSWLRWIGRGGALGQATRGMAVGLPLPICSCGVLPLYRSLIQRGLPLPAAMAFLIATPEIGLTALFVSVPLLGWELTAVRVATAALLAIVVAVLVARQQGGAPAAATTAAASCCGNSGCCDTTKPPQNRIVRGLRAGLVDLVDDTVAWMLTGLLVAAAATPYVETLFTADWPPLLEVMLFAALGMPVYVCAAGATPLIAVLIAGGVSPGAAVAFLLTGPATNVSTFGVLRQLHGQRTALRFAVIAASGAILLGTAINLLAPASLAEHVPTAHEMTHGLFDYACLLALTALYVASLLRKGGRRLAADLWDGHAASA